MIPAMDGSFLSPEEQQFYSSLFSTLDRENTGRIVKAAEVQDFFLLSKLTPEVLHQITEICGANRLGYFGRSQFYIALKLIAMAQNAIPLPVSKDMMVQGIDVPLPTFEVNPGAPTSQDPDDPGQMEFVNPAFIDHGPERGFPLSGKRPPPLDWNVGDVRIVAGPQASPRGPVIYPQVEPVTAMSPTRASNVPPQLTGSPPPSSPQDDSTPFTDNPPVTSPSHPIGIERHKSLPSPISPREHRPGLEKQGSINVFPSVTDEGWAAFERARKGEPQPGPPLQSTQSLDISLNSTLDTSWAKFPDSESGSHGSHSSHDEDVWLIMPEQRAYYTKQFLSLQSDRNGLLSGAQLKEFFEKSKLPTSELSKIWQLSDVNKDGTLSLAEFCTAMHLVVARKHKVDLPEQLPACLIPVIGPKQDEVPTFITPDSNPQQPQLVTPARSVTPPTPSTKTDENWATFTDSPFPPAPSPSSQSPANFDFASISPDPEAKIFQPIAVHVMPDGKMVSMATEADTRQRTHSDPLRAEENDDENEDPNEDSVFMLKKRAATVGEREMLAKIAPPPPVERSRRGDSLERGIVCLPLESPDRRLNYLPRSRSRSYSGSTLQQRIPAPLSRQTVLTECTAEPQGEPPTPGAHETLLPPIPPPRYNGVQSRCMSLDRTKLISLPERQMIPGRPTIPPRPSTHLSSHSSERTRSSSASSSRNSSYSSSAAEDEVAAQDQTDFADFSQFESHAAARDKSLLTATAQGDYQPMDEVSPGTSPPLPPPRHAQGDEHTPTKSATIGVVTSTPISSKDRYKSSDMLQADDKRSQFANDRKRHTSAPEPVRASSDLMLCDRKSIQAAIRRAKEENTKLSRHNSELQQELSQVMEDRLSLEIDLKKLRPFAANT